MRTLWIVVIVILVLIVAAIIYGVYYAKHDLKTCIFGSSVAGVGPSCECQSSSTQSQCNSKNGIWGSAPNCSDPSVTTICNTQVFGACIGPVPPGGTQPQCTSPMLKNQCPSGQTWSAGKTCSS